MNFSIRLALSIAVLVACTAVTGIAAVMAINDQHARLQTTNERYQELRGLYEIGSRASGAKLLRAAPANDPVEVRRQLLAAVQATDRLLQQSQAAPEQDRSHLRATLENMRGNLESSLVAEQRPSASTSSSTTPSASASAGTTASIALNACLSQIAALSADATAAINNDRQAMTQRIERTQWTLGLLTAATLVLAVMLGVWQHRAIAKPLKALRRGMEGVTRQPLREPIEPIAESGPREFRELIRRFNHMRDEIHALQHSLSQQVEHKSQQLIRSERLAGLGYLAAGLAHEINNPLGVIGGYAETMLRRLEACDAHANGAANMNIGDANPSSSAMLHDLGDALRTISEEVFRCQDITTGLLQMTRAGGVEEKLESIDLVALVERTTHMLQRLPLCNDRQLKVESLHAGPLLTRGHRAQLTQVLINLITNALEATEPGTGAVRITIDSKAGSARVRIEDNGCGMTDDTLEHAFDPLFSDKTRRGLAGFGLGLSVSHGIVERHAGRIDAESDGPEKGSTFTLELPAMTLFAGGEKR